MSEKLKQQTEHAQHDTPCPLCAGRDFRWGVTVSDHPGGRLYVRPDGTSWGEGLELRARICKDCGNVQFFIKG